MLHIANHIRTLKAADAVAYLGDSNDIPTKAMVIASAFGVFPVGQAIGPVPPCVVIMDCVNGREYRAEAINLAPVCFVEEIAA